MKQLFISLICLFAVSFLQSQTVLDEGKLDLSRSQDFQQAIKIQGEAEFYWHQLLAPEDFPLKSDVNKRFVKIPHVWNDFQLDSYTRLNPRGYGTYRFSVTVPKGENRVSIKIPTIGTSALFYVNGEKLIEIGKVGKSESAYEAMYAPQIIDLPHDTNHFEFIIQVSNYDFSVGGIWDSVIIGPEQTLRESHNRSIFWDFFLLGALFIAAIYFLALYFLKRDSIWHVYFALACLLAALNVSASDEFVLSYIPGISFSVLIKSEIVSFYAGVGVLSLYLYELFKSYFHKWVLFTIIVVSFIMSGIMIFLPTHLSAQTITFYQFFSLIALVYLLFVVVRAIRNGARGGWVFLLGFFVLAGAILHDVIINLSYIPTDTMSRVGIFVFLISQIILLADRSVRTKMKNEKLTEKLNEVNQQLESQVEERTEELHNSLRELKLAQQKLEKTNGELTKANEAKNKYLSVIGHDLRGPVSGIKVALELLLDDLEKGDIEREELTDTIKALTQNANSAYSLLVNLFDWARSQMGVMSFTPQKFRVSKILNDVDALLHKSLEEKDLELVNNIPQGLEVYGDPNMISTVFRNLISNAIKFSYPGQKITLTCDQNEQYVEFAVQDQGKGIPLEKQEKLFEFSAKKSTRGTKQEKGTGIGLLLVKDFIDQNNGKITVSSSPDKGSTFYFTLPLNND
ncbi:sensor histidine kinase [Salibacter halophilus]|uniref:histidine kinase n=1 Tax=Salibacter halophilus TaxID=1803916 RepID=A0A6N6M6N9_9FLAO|nr:sensor histidine kinase [Salibacter halophilus]KAB1061820.1 GHKL domain-containing protein [Salibacter halophilus]